ncbi:hypothetical protein RUM44_013056 [Polyplax serrata]|uniref:Nose resistant-to-fluoxetine protein N-terminal domain-containing protein n=1 Tax=Polyplax serrata TaxID=468196 RepID=A0ABR1BDD8_POLSC
MHLLDATGSYSFTFLFGNDYWLGSQTACLDFTYSRNLNDSPPFPVAFYTAKYHISLNISSHRPVRVITMGICLPAECPETDLRLILNDLSTSATSLKAFRMVPNKDYNFYLEPVGIILVIITFFGILLVIIGTWIDVGDEKKHREEFSQGQRNKEIVQNKTSLKVSTIEKIRFYRIHESEMYIAYVTQCILKLKEHPYKKQVTEVEEVNGTHVTTRNEYEKMKQD